MQLELTGLEKFQIILKIVCKYYDVHLDLIFSKSRKRHLVKPRQIVQYLSNKHTFLSLAKIGEYTGGKDHATVLHAKKTIQNLIDVDKKIHLEINSIESSIKEKFSKPKNSGTILGLKKIELCKIIRSCHNESEIEIQLLSYFNLSQDLRENKNLKSEVEKLSKITESITHPTIKELLNLPKQDFEKCIKYKIEPHLKMSKASN